MQTQSLWEHTLTFFPQFLATLRERVTPDATVAVVGASDGKFVLPLAAAGYRVVAIERDAVALHGGAVHLPGDSQAHALGLIDRLKLEELHERVEVVEDDFLDGEPLGRQCDAVWTSCSWHYSANHHRPLGEFVDRMQRLVRPGGVFGAEFMMPVERRHHMIEHYTFPERLHPHFTGDWEVLLTLRTTEFTERAHVGQLHDHTHRMGLLLAAQTSTLTDHF
ncbi:class I SAM-dependent methyltransferase [Streptomyces anulatus]|uniref:Class I SAM-dependent methyltransferase n=1 Tax=Streptomyces sp. SID7499 TaxID=2706086 RepID=A0A6G3XW51_9ACTN|nr:class I SAM-dependent methyltransferase [Streptomyces anulatus]NDZ58241.1 class I SAM-dependent methyltransferase [Streptomyces anulatus]NEE21730.1 class I SAM-dependent methyltransferase [Streptomyces sp. SID7499]